MALQPNTTPATEISTTCRHDLPGHVRFGERQARLSAESRLEFDDLSTHGQGLVQPLLVPFQEPQAVSLSIHGGVYPGAVGLPIVPHLALAWTGYNQEEAKRAAVVAEIERPWHRHSHELAIFVALDAVLLARVLPGLGIERIGPPERLRKFVY